MLKSVRSETAGRWKSSFCRPLYVTLLLSVIKNGGAAAAATGRWRRRCSGGWGLRVGGGRCAAAVAAAAAERARDAARDGAAGAGVTPPLHRHNRSAGLGDLTWGNQSRWHWGRSRLRNGRGNSIQYTGSKAESAIPKTVPLHQNPGTNFTGGLLYRISMNEQQCAALGGIAVGSKAIICSPSATEN